MTIQQESTNRDFQLHIRKLRERIVVGSKTNKPHCILITGMDPRVGTTSIASNLAYDLNRIDNYKVLYINGKGKNKNPNDLFLSGADLSEAITPLSPPKNIFCAETSSQYTESTWSNGKTLENHFNLLSKNFDYILIDMPTFSSAPNMLRIVPYVDLVLITIEANKSKWQTVNKLKQTLEEAQANEVSIIINKKQNYIPGFLYRWL